MSELEERLMQRGNPVDITQLEPFDIPLEDTAAWAERNSILADVRKNYENKARKKLSEGGEQDEWAMIIGRFQPFQPGHTVLFETANIAAKNTLVVIGSANRIDEENPFPPEDREIMIRKYYKDRGFSGKLEIVYQDDLFGDKPGSTDQQWGDDVLQKAKERGIVPDVVISNHESTWINGIFTGKNKRIYKVDTVKREDLMATNKRKALRDAGIIQSGVNHLTLPLRK